MKITKRQLKQIIKEEKTKLLKEYGQGEIYDLPDYAEFLMLAVTDEAAAIEWVRGFIERWGSNRYIDQEEMQSWVNEAKKIVRGFAEDLNYSL
jgi:hypothetical protein